MNKVTYVLSYFPTEVTTGGRGGGGGDGLRILPSFDIFQNEFPTLFRVEERPSICKLDIQSCSPKRDLLPTREPPLWTSLSSFWAEKGDAGLTFSKRRSHSNHDTDSSSGSRFLHVPGHSYIFFVSLFRALHRFQLPFCRTL